MQSPTRPGCAGVLGAIQKHFKAPPASVLDAWDPAKLLDSMPFNKSDVYSSTNANIIEQLLQQPSELHLAVRPNKLPHKAKEADLFWTNRVCRCA